MSRASQVLTLQVLVDELLDQVTATEDTTWSPLREAVASVAERAALAAAARDRAQETRNPARAAPAASGGVWEAHQPARPPAARPRKRLVRDVGLLDQLADLAGHAWAATGGDGPSRSTPDSRVPPGAVMLEVLADLEAAVAAAWTRYTPPDTPARRRARDVPGMLRGLVGQATDPDALSDDQVTALVAEASSWVRSARLALGWDVPVVALAVRCPDCDGWGTLRVRADASSDVWCSGPVIGPPREWEPYPRRCGQRWPRTRWIVLLDHITDTEHPEAS